MASSASASTMVQLTCSAEQTALSCDTAHSPLAMVSLLAPAAVETAQRTPLEIVAVVDRSGSMGGQKMNIMKETLEFLVTKGLQQGDAFGIVAFDDKVETRLPLTVMDGSGRKAAADVVQALNTGGTTNLSGGLLQGIDLVQRGAASAASRTRAVLVFTDGIANCGIRDGPGMLAAAQGAMGGAPITLFTFGFGQDHQEDTLRSLADNTNGLYYFIQKAEDIPQAFVDCLGGLVSVVAQNATLTLEAAAGTATLGEVHSHYRQAAGASPSRVELNLGDLYAEDEKDVLLQLELPALSAAVDEPALTLRATLRYFSVGTSRIEEVSTTLDVRRPAGTPPAQPVNLKLDEQRNRVAVAQAMERASRMADDGHVDKGLELLRAQCDQSKRTPSAATPLVQQLCADLERVASGYVDKQAYRMHGAKMCKMQAMSHAQQRSNYTEGSAEMYEKKSKAAYKRASLPFFQKG